MLPGESRIACAVSYDMSPGIGLYYTILHNTRYLIRAGEDLNDLDHGLYACVCNNSKRRRTLLQQPGMLRVAKADIVIYIRHISPP